MRGSVDYDKLLYNTSVPERNVMSEFINERLENEMKKQSYAVY